MGAFKLAQVWAFGQRDALALKKCVNRISTNTKYFVSNVEVPANPYSINYFIDIKLLYVLKISWLVYELYIYIYISFLYVVVFYLISY